MKASISTVASAPEQITVGGHPHSLHAMRPHDDGLYERWYQSRAREEMRLDGMAPAEAQKLSMSIRGDDPLVFVSRNTRQGMLRMIWIALRNPPGMTFERMSEELTDDEMVGAIDAINRLNSGPPERPSHPQNPPTQPRPSAGQRITSFLRSLFRSVSRPTRSSR